MRSRRQIPAVESRDCADLARRTIVDWKFIGISPCRRFHAVADVALAKEALQHSEICL
jgi:hypothetical protein